MTKANLQKSSKWLEMSDRHHPGYHRTCSSPDDKGDFDRTIFKMIRNERLGVLSLKYGHALVKRTNFQPIKATYISKKNNVSIGEGSVLIEFSHNRKLDLGCLRFTHRWSFGGNTGSNKNRRKSLKVHKPHTGKCFILILNHRYVMNWSCKPFPIKSKITCVIMDQ